MENQKTMDKDALGTRMKDQYENRTRYCLPRRTYAIIRADGKAWHTYTRGLVKPFDANLIKDLDTSIVSTLPHIQGAVFAYTQSDEISILLTDFESIQTSAWFDNNIQKMASVAASVLTAEFNRCRTRRLVQEWNDELCSKDNRHLLGDVLEKLVHESNPAYFDARVFTIPDRVEVMNYFLWRQLDCVRNSVSAVAQANFSHRELQGKSSAEQQEMIHDKGVSWVNDYSAREKNGALIVKENYEISIKDVNYQVPDDEKIIGLATDGLLHETVTRSRWVSKGAWKFTENKDKLLAMIPTYPT